MSTPVQSPTVDSPLAPSHSPAVERCISAYTRVVSASKSRNLSFEDKQRAIEAFRRSMPDLITREGIRDFIACVGYGLLTEIFKEKEATRLLYAAQVAIGAAPRDPAPAKAKA